MTQTDVESVTNEILRALVPAPPDRKAAALKALLGEAAAPAAKPVTGPLLLGMGAAAAFLGVSRSTLWRIIQSGKVEKVELFPGSYRVRREDLIALAAGDLGSSGKESRRGRPPKDARKRDPRFRQLKALADEGNEEAATDLFKEFQFDHGAGRFVGTDGTQGTRLCQGSGGQAGGTNGQENQA